MPIVLSILVATYLVSKFNKSRLASAIRSNMRLFVSFVVSLQVGMQKRWGGWYEALLLHAPTSSDQHVEQYRSIPLTTSGA